MLAWGAGAGVVVEGDIGGGRVEKIFRRRHLDD